MHRLEGYALIIAAQMQKLENMQDNVLFQRIRDT